MDASVDDHFSETMASADESARRAGEAYASLLRAAGNSRASLPRSMQQAEPTMPAPPRSAVHQDRAEIGRSSLHTTRESILKELSYDRHDTTSQMARAHGASPPSVGPTRQTRHHRDVEGGRFHEPPTTSLTRHSGAQASGDSQPSNETQTETSQRTSIPQQSASATETASPSALPPKMSLTAAPPAGDGVEDDIVSQLRDINRLKDKVIAKLQATVEEAAVQEMELKRALRDALKQLKTALEQARAADERERLTRIESERMVRNVDVRLAACEAERAALARRCRELESRDADRAADLADRAAEATALRGELRDCRRELKALRADAAVSLTQQHYFESTVKSKRHLQRT